MPLIHEMIVPSRWTRYLDMEELLNEIIIQLANNDYRCDLPIEISGATAQLTLSENYEYWWFKEWLDVAEYPYDFQEPGELVPNNHQYRYILISNEIIARWCNGRERPAMELNRGN